MKENNTKEIIIVSMLTAIVFIATKFLAFETGVGYYHAGDIVLFSITIGLSAKYGIVAGSIGMGLSDFLSGAYTYYTLPTIVIKTIMVIIVVSILSVKIIKKDGFKYVVAMVTAGIAGTLLYFQVDLIYSGYGAASLNILPNLMQSAIIGTAGAMLLIPRLKTIKQSLNIK